MLYENSRYCLDFNRQSLKCIVHKHHPGCLLLLIYVNTNKDVSQMKNTEERTESFLN